MTSPMQDARPLLIELLCEELPPKALHTLGLAFAHAVRDGLASHGLLAQDCALHDFATPRRLALRLTRVLAQAAPRTFTEKLMPAAIGLTAEGAFTPALVKKLAAKGLSHLQPADLIHTRDGKQDFLTAQGTVAGAMLADALQSVLDQAIAGLPIPKVMRYQLADGASVKFVRPAHALTVLWGDAVLDVTALGLAAGNTTQGHRFLGAQHIALRDATTYEQQLLDEGKVVAAYGERRQDILDQLQRAAQALGASLGAQDDVDALLDEVTALVELPAVYVGQFDPVFLDVPPECLILTMRLNQKYFPLFDADSGKLTHRFLIVSNMRIPDPTNIIEGNARVVRPRLADARFFFETDRKRPLHARIPTLAQVVYHNKLGSQLQRSQRMERIARFLAQRLDADEALAARAAQLLKADLTTDMVAEFPELQGIMGAYYAQADGEDAQVVRALRGQYRIHLENDVTPDTRIAAISFMAERAETLVGIWGIGLTPTGERDPYALRRAALGLISALEQAAIGSRVHLDALLEAAWHTFETGVLADGTVDAVRHFVYERYRHQLYGMHDKHIVDAVIVAVAPPLHEVRARIQACTAFVRLPEAASLIAANKRIRNLLKKADASPAALDVAALTQPAEHTLAQAIETLTPIVQAQLQQKDFTASLTTLAGLRRAVDDFFEQVMVMDEDPAVRANRLALLYRLHGLMNQVADITRLAQ